jgi:SAM-dependent methyltransferase
MDLLISEGLIIKNWKTTETLCPKGWVSVIESKLLPFTNYPYEWSFNMLKDAAILTLDLTEQALENGFIIKDASAFNIFFEGSCPRFIDVTSFCGYKDGDPWVAYGQFCDHFLAPLMLEAYKGIPFQPFLRGNLDGISISNQLAHILGFSCIFKPGVLKHIILRALVEKQSQDLDTQQRKKVRKIKIPKRSILKNIRNQKELISKLNSKYKSQWSDYEEKSSYTLDMLEKKKAFLNSAVERVGKVSLALDFGANIGRYTQILAKRFNYVVGLDYDPGVIDKLYLSIKGGPLELKILPLVIDVMNPSPAQGWRCMERSSFLSRARADFSLYFAFIHHICLGHGVPLTSFIDLIFDLAEHSVIEFVSLDDPMSEKILATRRVAHADYNLMNFRNIISTKGVILEEKSLSKTRTLFFVSKGLNN